MGLAADLRRFEDRLTLFEDRPYRTDGVTLAADSVAVEVDRCGIAGMVSRVGVDRDRSILEEAFQCELEIGIVQRGLPSRVQQIEATIQINASADDRRVGAGPILRPVAGPPRGVLPEVEARAEPLEVQVIISTCHQLGAIGELKRLKDNLGVAGFTSLRANL